jgi:hypothetical protein
VAYDFDGTQYVSWAAPVTSAPFTIACWMNKDALSLQALVALLDAAGDNDDEWVLTPLPEAIVRYHVKDGTATNPATGNQYATGAWHHVCAVEASASSHRLVLDGDWANAAFSATTLSPDNVDTLSLGVILDPTPSQFYNGKAAELAVWNVALAQAQVEMLAEGLSPLLVNPGALVFYAPLVSNFNDIVGGLVGSTT